MKTKSLLTLPDKHSFESNHICSIMKFRSTLVVVIPVSSGEETETAHDYK